MALYTMRTQEMVGEGTTSVMRRQQKVSCDRQTNSGAATQTTGSIGRPL